MAKDYDIRIEKDANYEVKMYQSGVDFSTMFTRMRGVSHSGLEIFDWSTSGGQITNTGSEIYVKSYPTLAYPDGTSGLPSSVGNDAGKWDIVAVSDAGSTVNFKLRGQFQVVETYSRD